MFYIFPMFPTTEKVILLLSPHYNLHFWDGSSSSRLQYRQLTLWVWPLRLTSGLLFTKYGDSRSNFISTMFTFDNSKSYHRSRVHYWVIKYFKHNSRHNYFSINNPCKTEIWSGGVDPLCLHISLTDLRGIYSNLLTKEVSGIIKGL